MNARAHWARLKKVGLEGALLLAEAGVALTLSSVAVALLPFAALARRLSSAEIPSHAPGEDEQRLMRHGRWAVEAAAKRLPWRTMCFQKGLALHAMMRRRGIDTRLHYGVSQSAERGLRAHVWVSHRGVDLIGGEVASDFVCLATFPSEPSHRSGGAGAS